jgi:hypothetical protein
MRSPQRRAAIGRNDRCVPPALFVAAAGAVSAEIVLLNQRAFLFPTDRCWAEDCPLALKSAPAHIGKCAQCAVAGFCSKECQVRCSVHLPVGDAAAPHFEAYQPFETATTITLLAKLSKNILFDSSSLNHLTDRVCPMAQLHLSHHFADRSSDARVAGAPRRV